MEKVDQTEGGISLETSEPVRSQIYQQIVELLSNSSLELIELQLLRRELERQIEKKEEEINTVIPPPPVVLDLPVITSSEIEENLPPPEVEDELEPVTQYQLTVDFFQRSDRTELRKRLKSTINFLTDAQNNGHMSAGLSMYSRTVSPFTAKFLSDNEYQLVKYFSQCIENVSQEFFTL
jgi:hypothetical protein